MDSHIYFLSMRMVERNIHWWHDGHDQGPLGNESHVQNPIQCLCVHPRMVWNWQWSIHVYPSRCTERLRWISDHTITIYSLLLIMLTSLFDHIDPYLTSFILFLYPRSTYTFILLWTSKPLLSKRHLRSPLPMHLRHPRYLKYVHLPSLNPSCLSLHPRWDVDPMGHVLSDTHTQSRQLLLVNWLSTMLPM